MTRIDVRLGRLSVPSWSAAGEDGRAAPFRQMTRPLRGRRHRMRARLTGRDRKLDGERGAQARGALQDDPAAERLDSVPEPHET